MFSNDKKQRQCRRSDKKENDNERRKRKQITSMIKGCSLVQFAHNCAVLCNHLYRVTQASRFYAN